MADNAHFDWTFWQKLSQDWQSSCVRLVNKKLHLSFPPFYFNDVKKSVRSVIEQRLNHYESDLGGILAACGKIAIVGPRAEIMFNLAEIHVDVQGEFFIFNPSIGSQLTGIVNKKSVGHISCLVHGLFNISLPKPFAMPAQSWKGTQANLNDEVVFTVTRVDFQSQVPYIEGNIVEVKICQSEPTDLRERTCSDSGVSVASDETTSAKKPRKGSRLSLSKSNDSANESLAETSEVMEGDAETSKTPVDSAKKKRKRDGGDVAAAGEETPKKKVKPAAEECDEELGDLVSDLFTAASKELASAADADEKPFSNTSSLTKSSGKKKTKSSRQTIDTSSSTGKQKKRDVGDAESIIKELMSSVHKMTPSSAVLPKVSKKKLNMSQDLDPKLSQIKTEPNQQLAANSQTSENKKSKKKKPNEENDRQTSDKQKKWAHMDSVDSESSTGSGSKLRKKAKEAVPEDIIKELITSVQKSTPISETPKSKTKKKLSMSSTAEDSVSSRNSLNQTETPGTPKSSCVSKSWSVAVKKEKASPQKNETSHEMLINSILKSVQKKK